MVFSSKVLQCLDSSDAACSAHVSGSPHTSPITVSLLQFIVCPVEPHLDSLLGVGLIATQLEAAVCSKLVAISGA